jgi:hypothetical protein
MQLAVDYAPPRYPQYKGKIERFFRTARHEMPRAQAPELAAILILEINRYRSAVGDQAPGS